MPSLVLTLSADEETLVSYLLDRDSGVLASASSSSSSSDATVSGAQLVDWLVSHADATPPPTPPRSRFAAASPPTLRASSPQTTSNGTAAPLVRRADALEFARRLASLGVVHVRDAAQLDDSPHCRCTLDANFQSTIVLRANPPSSPAAHDADTAADTTANASSADGVPLFPSRAPRTRPEWLDDKSCSACVSCRRKFTFTRRRHHCRSCGLIYCSRCCHQRVLLPHLGYQSKQLVCERCVNSFYSSTRFDLAPHTRRPRASTTGSDYASGDSGRSGESNSIAIDLRASLDSPDDDDAHAADNAFMAGLGLQVSFGGTDKQASRVARHSRSQLLPDQ